MAVRYTLLPSPIGELLLTANEAGALTRVYMSPHDVASEWLRDDAVLQPAREQLGAYFRGALKIFDLPFAPAGTDFQQRVWTALCAIPFGTTVSYGDIAKRIGDPGASRAVGLANGQNPLAIVVPCHRVIGASGALTGYGGGLRRKQWLLQHERNVLEPALFGLPDASTA
jgi:methylated-DNA-[protein]-cysteine S-methyltransferase